MELGYLTKFTSDFLWVVFILSLPIVTAATIIGIIVSLIQALTQIQDQTMPFLFKMIAVFVALAFSYHWMAETIINFSNIIFSQIRSSNVH
ncbi:type III secretion system export apparatus subunit SctS [Salmonella enterica]|nr:type III secretion system export apparatus subunit SctS [Salmonella enterica]